MSKQFSFDFGDTRSAIRNAHIALRLDGIVKDGYVIRFVSHPAASAKKASWFFRSKPRPGTHYITIGEKLASRATRVRTQEQLARYAVAHFYHEMAHSLFSDKDILGIARWCRINKIPFGLLNLFEDARVEHAWRRRGCAALNWLEFEARASIDSPAAALFAAIQADGDFSRLSDEGNQALIERMRDFYFPRIVQCLSTEMLKGILLAWVGEFATDSCFPTGGAGAGLGDLSQTLTLLADPKALDEMLGQSSPINGPQGKISESRSAVAEHAAEANLRGAKRGVGAGLLSKTPQVRLAPSLTQSLTEKCRPIFFGRTGRSLTDSATKRISTRAFFQSRQRFFRTFEEGGACEARTVVLLLDVSASMRGRSHEAGVSLAAAFNALAEEGVIEGHLILAGGFDFEKSRTLHQTLRMPVPPSILEHIPANGELEGIANAMDANEQLICEADDFFVYTDGVIEDRPVDKGAWQAKGVSSTALYVGDVSQAEAMHKCFDLALCRRGVLDLADALAAAR